jgi:hypothetical protein
MIGDKIDVIVYCGNMNETKVGGYVELSENDDNIFDYYIPLYKRIVYAIAPRWFTKCMWGGAIRQWVIEHPDIKMDKMLALLITMALTWALIKSTL